MTLDYYVTRSPKLSTVWIGGINVRGKTMKPLEENIGVRSDGLRYGKGLLDIKPSA